MIGAEMVFSKEIERRIGWVAFPGFLRYFALLHIMVYVLQIARPGIGVLLMFDRSRILAGEVWRLVTFLFASSGLGQFSSLGLVFMVFMVMIAFMMSDALESAWGVFKTSMFYYCGFVGLLVANFIQPGFDGMFLYEAAFFAFATLFPRVEFRVMFILPVQVRFLAILGAAGLIWPGFSKPVWLLYLLLIFANYLLWAGIPAMRGMTRVAASGRRRERFNSARPSAANAFHRCAICGRSEVSDPHEEFRVGRDAVSYTHLTLPTIYSV